MPHNLARCTFAERFRKLSDACGDGQLGAVRFYEQLTDTERTSCEYHGFDWATIADRSVQIIEALGTTPSDDDVMTAVMATGLPKMEAWFLYSLVQREPIYLDDA